MKYYQNLLKLIGKTPLVKINKINPNPDVLILAKCEKFNPAGSIKDRIAVNMIEAAHTLYSPEKCLECKKRCKLATIWDEEYVKSISEWWQPDKK